MPSTATTTCQPSSARPTRIRVPVCVLVTVLVGGLAAPARAQAPLPTETAPPMPAPAETADERGACDVSFGPADWICDRGLGRIGDAVASGADAAFRAVVGSVIDGAAWLLDQLATVIDASTRPDVTSNWFRGAYRNMAAVAALGLLPFVLLAIVQAVVRQDTGALLRSVGYVPVAALATGAAVVVVDMLVLVTDEMSSWIGTSLGADLTAFANGLGVAVLALSAPSGGTAALFAGLMAAGMIAFTAFAIWIELLLRQAAIYVAVLFLPLGFMAMVWPATAHWLRRLAQGLVAIILSKFVIMAVMALAATALDANTDVEGFAVVVSGGALLLLAALAPYVLLRLIPVFDAGVSSQLEGTARRPTAAVAPPGGGQLSRMVRAQISSGGASLNGQAFSAPDGDAASAEATGGPSGGARAGTGTAVLDASNGQRDATGSRASAEGAVPSHAATGAPGQATGSTGAGSAAAGSGTGVAAAGGAASSGVAGGAGAAVGPVAGGIQGAKATGDVANAHGEQVAQVGGGGAEARPPLPPPPHESLEAPPPTDPPPLELPDRRPAIPPGTHEPPPAPPEADAALGDPDR